MTKVSKIFGLERRTRLGVNVKGEQRYNKASIYLSYNKDDFDVASSLMEKILKDNDVFFYYINYKEFPKVDYQNTNKLISQLQLVIILITNNYLSSLEDGSEKELEYIRNNNIPFLPIIDDDIDFQLYEKYFKNIQYLDFNQRDETQIGVDKKFKDYLNHYIPNDEDYSIAKDAFDKFVFLSYRKKDRYLAIDLINKIHSYTECNKVAIWYDEYLVAGEEFATNLDTKISDCSALLLLVTPNLVNENNYIKTTEYPIAKERNKKIIPVEGLPTDEKELSAQYIAIPPVINDEQASLEVAKLGNGKKGDTPEALYARGIAYLYGVGVEINRQIAVELLEESAKKGYMPANDKLLHIFTTGNGVVADFERAKKYVNVLLKHYKAKLNYKLFDENAYLYFTYLMFGININQRLTFDNNASLEDMESNLKELLKFTKAKNEFNEYFVDKKIELYISLVIGGRNAKVSRVDFLASLVTAQANKKSIYHIGMFCYFIGYELYDKNNNSSNEELIDKLFFLLDNAYKQNPKEACTILNNCYNTILKSLRFSAAELASIYRRFLKYFDYFKDEKERINQSAELRVELYDTTAYIERANEQENLEELKLLERNYERRSREDSLLMGIYHRLYLRSRSKEESMMYLTKAKRELEQLSDTVFNVKERRKAKYDILFGCIRQNESLSFDERIKEIEKIYKQVKDEKRYDEALDILKIHLYGIQFSKGNAKKIIEYYEEAKELKSLIENSEQDEFYYAFTYACAKKELSHIEKDFHEWINLAISNSNLPEDKKLYSMMDVIGMLITASYQSPIANLKELAKVINLFSDFIKDNKTFTSSVNLSLYYLNIMSSGSFLFDDDSIKPCQEHCIQIQYRHLKTKNIDKSVLIKGLEDNGRIAIKLIRNDLNNKGKLDKSLLEYVKLLVASIKAIGFTNMPVDVTQTIGTIALCSSIFLNEPSLWIDFSIQPAIVDYTHAFVVSLYLEVVKHLNCSNKEKAIYLKDCINVISKQAIDVLAKHYALNKGIFILVLNAVMQKDFEMLDYFYEMFLDELPFDIENFRLVNYVRKLQFYNDLVLKKDHEKPIFNYQAFNICLLNIATDCFDLMDALCLYGDLMETDEYRESAYGAAIISSIYIYIQYEQGLKIDLFKLTTRMLTCLDKTDATSDLLLTTTMCPEAFDTFNKIDKLMIGKAPLWYIQHRVRFMAYFYEYCYTQNHLEAAINDFNNFFHLFEDFNLEEDFTDSFPRAIAAVARCCIDYYEPDGSEQLTNLVNMGFKYHLNHLNDHNLSAYSDMYLVFYKYFNEPFYESLARACSDEEENDYIPKVMAFRNIIYGCEGAKDYKSAIFFALKLVDYLDTLHEEDEDNKEFIKSKYRESYLKASELSELLGNDKDAFQYKELSKRYK